ncbi:restriction endonuclease [Halobacillus mangrovi]|uniref:Restriction endonuclease type IV Mrr domain-containing protein n=1 Tax=Halobacillus mangrovi TaxID=402384 RepID=A0A1W5ZVG2_9BACI|nr:restriction endonuclease [Halobacillus mangrovi]ARI77294.1 hypothetical protein HM131_10770 [Halobacillus mangrovi]
MFKYYLKQFKRVNKFKYWKFMDKIKFIGISNIIGLALLSVIPSINYLTFLITFGIFMSIGYIIFLTIELLFSKTVIRRKSRIASTKGYLLNEVDKMNADQFEELLLHLFKHQGYYAKRTSESQTYRADLLLKKDSQSIDVHVKKCSDKLSLPDINEIIEKNGNPAENNKWIVTNSYFTKTARVQTQKDKVKLLDRNDIVDMLNDYHLHSIRLWKKDKETSKTVRGK